MFPESALEEGARHLEGQCGVVGGGTEEEVTFILKNKQQSRWLLVTRKKGSL